MTHDGGAELGTKVPLKNTPHLAEKGHPSPPQKVTTLLSSLPTINTLINPEEDAKKTTIQVDTLGWVFAHFVKNKTTHE